jgi:spermidine synthase
MEDTLSELRRHTPIFMRAKGRLLVTGLGLGVVRGLLAKPEVEHIDVVEIDRRHHSCGRRAVEGRRARDAPSRRCALDKPVDAALQAAGEPTQPTTASR